MGLLRVRVQANGLAQHFQGFVQLLRIKKPQPAPAEFLGLLFLVRGYGF